MIKLMCVLLTLLLASGCIGKELNDKTIEDLPMPYDNGRTFSLSGCEGIEVAHEWVGPHGPNGPETPPSGWQLEAAKYEFSWMFEMLKCNSIGWGPIERGPIYFGMELHNAYNAPANCLNDLPERTTVRFIHQLYWDDSEVVNYSIQWKIPASATEFAIDKSQLKTIRIELEPEGSSTSVLDLYQPGAYEGEAAEVNVALFWFDGDLVHRLTLHRETRLTQGDVAVVDMEAPSIMTDLPSPTPMPANWLSNLQWTGDLVTFTDHECTARVEA